MNSISPENGQFCGARFHTDYSGYHTGVSFMMDKKANWVNTTIEIGLEKPFRVLHLSDSHLCLADARDDERKNKLAHERSKAFDASEPGRTERNLKEQLAYAKTQQLPILYTGDFCDFVSAKNLEYMKETLFSCDCFFAAGNHEYSLYVGEAFEDDAYKMRSYARVQSYVPNDLRFASRIIGGVNFVAVDNTYYDFTSKSLEQLMAEVERGLPIVLMCHTPLYTPELAAHEMSERGNPCAYVVGAPDALVDTYPLDRAIQQRTHSDTQRFIDYIYHQPAIRAILAGHAHHHFETRLPNGVMQYVTGGGYCGCAREICFI